MAREAGYEVIMLLNSERGIVASCFWNCHLSYAIAHFVLCSFSCYGMLCPRSRAKVPHWSIEGLFVWAFCVLRLNDGVAGIETKPRHDVYDVVYSVYSVYSYFSSHIPILGADSLRG